MTGLRPLYCGSERSPILKPWFAPLALERPRPRADVQSLLIEGDCLEAMRCIPDRSINLILCDLPYGTTQNAWDSLIALDRLWDQYERVLAQGGAILLMGQGPFTAHLIQSNLKLFKYKIVWVKSKPTNFLNAKKQPLRRHEDICVFYPGQATYNPVMGKGEPYNKGVRKNQLTGSYGEFKPAEIKSKGSRYPTDVFYCKTAESEGPVWHSTQKPVELARYLIRTYSNAGDIVLDNAFGSGSFILAAGLEGRHAIGIELNEAIQAFKMEPLDLIDVARTRLGEWSIEPRIRKRADWGHNSLTSEIASFLGDI